MSDSVFCVCTQCSCRTQFYTVQSVQFTVHTKQWRKTKERTVTLDYHYLFFFFFNRHFSIRRTMMRLTHVHKWTSYTINSIYSHTHIPYTALLAHFIYHFKPFFFFFFSFFILKYFTFWDLLSDSEMCLHVLYIHHIHISISYHISTTIGVSLCVKMSSLWESMFSLRFSHLWFYDFIY